LGTPVALLVASEVRVLAASNRSHELITKAGLEKGGRPAVNRCLAAIFRRRRPSPMENNEQQIQMAREIREHLRKGDPLVDIIRKLSKQPGVQMANLVSAVVVTTGITRMSAMGIVDAVLNNGLEQSPSI